MPCTPVARLSNHRAAVNGMAWAPHSSCHICTSGMFSIAFYTLVLPDESCACLDRPQRGFGLITGMCFSICSTRVGERLYESWRKYSCDVTEMTRGREGYQINGSVLKLHIFQMKGPQGVQTRSVFFSRMLVKISKKGDRKGGLRLLFWV